MARLHHNLLQAVLDADIDDNDTTITFTAPLREWGEDNIATITAPDVLAIRIGYELLHITAYTSGASSATVLRGQEGSTATAHAEGDAIRHVPTADDFDSIDLAGHLADTSDAHDAAAISYAGGTGMSATDVEAAIDELATEKANLTGGTFSGDVSVPDEAYNATNWNGSLEVPTKNAVRDQMEALAAGAVTDGDKGDITVSSSGSVWTIDNAARKEVLIIAIGDETTAITTGTAKVTFRMPFAMTLTAVRASLTTVSSSGIPTFDINEGGSTILSTKLTIDASEKTSTTAATAAVISDTALADDAEITIDVDVAGTGAAGAKIYLIGVRA